MQIDASLLFNALADAEARSLRVYERSKERKDAKRSGIFASGRYEGLKEALRLLEAQGGRKPAHFVPLHDRSLAPPFAAIFQKRRPPYGWGSEVLGTW